ncbi:MAG TPA: hypothetical protein VFP22_02420, partial [Candidatus Limnocylindrales bacterium]|nr:hypothetical protein [Candidatus Limnocylindrales bacterium]
ILSTEHWSLLATRSLSWNESFSRAGLFLSVVSATAVALALVGQASAFGSQFVAFALVMLPVALFVGLATFTRLDEVNAEDALWVAGMNRIRHAYMEMGPGLAPYFVTGTHDDPAGLEQTFGIHRPGTAIAHWIVTMPGMVAVIDGVLGGLIAGLGVNAVSGMAMQSSIVVGAVVGLAIPIVLAVRSRSSVRWLIGVYRPRFPSGDSAIVRGHDAVPPLDGGEDDPGEAGA